MSASKEFKMTFNMSAKADGSFSSTFSKAQQELSKMQQEIQRLNSVQGDISSYQKQQQAIEATTRKLERLKEQQKLLNKQKEEMRAAGQSTTALEREEKKLEQSVDNTNTKLQQQQQKLTQTGERLRQAGVDTSNLTSESKRLEQEMGQLKNEQEKVAEGAQKSGQAMAEAFDAAASAMAAAGIVAGLKQIYDAFAECVNVAAEFEATMSTVEALSGANGEEMEALSAQAKELGATTVFSAQEAGDAMTYMGMAGWKAQDMISGMDGVLNLAAASGEDLAMVSDIVTDNLTAFGLKASDTARFADVLAAAATNSNTSVNIMGETFKQSAAIAGALGYSVEDVAVAVGLMANAGIKGSIAGTALKNTFNGLLEGATLSGEALGEYEFTAIQADGTMKDFKSTLDELRSAFSQMSEAEKVQNAQLIAGKRGYNGLLAILNATEEDYNKLTNAINNSSGAAERMAKIKLDNLKGDLALANSAAEAFKDSVGEALIPELRKLTQAGTGAISWAAGFAEEHQAATAAAAGLTTGLLDTAGAVIALSAAVKVFKALEMGAMFTSLPGQIMLAVGAFAGLVLAVDAAEEAMKAQRGEYYQLTAESQKHYKAVENARAAYERAAATKGKDAEETIALRARLDELTESYEENKNILSEWQAENEDLISSVQEMQQAYRDTVNGIEDESVEAMALAKRLETLANKTNRTEDEQKQMLAIVGRLNTALPDLNLSYDQNTGTLTKNTAAIKAAAKAQAQQRYEQEKQEHYSDLLVEQARLTDQVEEAQESLTIAQERLNQAQEAGAGIGTLHDREGYEEAAADVAMYQSELDALQGSLDSVNAELGDYDAKMAEAASGTQSAEAAVSSIQSALGTLSTAYSEAYTAAQESFQGQFGLFEEAAAVTATSFDTIISNLNSQKEYWANYGENFNTVQQAAQEFDIDISAIMARLSDGSPEAAAGIAGLADEIRNSADGGKQALSELEEAFSGAQSQMDETAQTVASASDNVQTALSDLQTMVQDGAQNLDMPDQFRAAMENNLNAVTEAFSSGADIPEAMSVFQMQISEGLAEIDVGTELAQSIESAGGQAAAAVTQVGAHLAAESRTAMGQMKDVLASGTAEAMQGATDAATTGGQNLSTATGTAATSSGTSFKGGMPPSVFSSAAASAMQAAISAVQSKQGALVAAARAAGQAAAAAFSSTVSAVKAGGFASGTRSAPQGLAWVGEKGPELVYFHGGETIIPDTATVAALNSAAMLVGTHGPELMYMQGGETVIPAGQTQTILSQHQKELETINAYASGTDNAERGLALAGEHGPELMYMQGGETVIPAVDTMRTLQASQLTPGSAADVEPGISQAVIMLPQAMEAMTAYYRATEKTKAEAIRAERMDRIMESIRNYDLRGSGSQDGASGSDGTPVVVNFNVTINGTASNDVLSQLRAFATSEEFRDNVRDAVQEAERDRMRRAYR